MLEDSAFLCASGRELGALFCACACRARAFFAVAHVRMGSDNTIAQATESTRGYLDAMQRALVGVGLSASGLGLHDTLHTIGWTMVLSVPAGLTVVCMQRVADAPEAVGLLRYLLIEDAPWPQRLQWVREYGLNPRMAIETVHHSKVDEFNRLFAEHGSASPVGVPMVYGNVCTRCLPGPAGRCVCGSQQRKRNRMAWHRIASCRIASQSQSQS